MLLLAKGSGFTGQRGTLAHLSKMLQRLPLTAVVEKRASRSPGVSLVYTCSRHLSSQSARLAVFSQPAFSRRTNRFVLKEKVGRGERKIFTCAIVLQDCRHATTQIFCCSFVLFLRQILLLQMLSATILIGALHFLVLFLLPAGNVVWLWRSRCML